MSNIHGLVTKVAIKADAQGNAPTEIELLRTGTWHTPWHGDFEVTLADLHEFAANFAKGVGLVADDPKLPINYAHESWDKAAAWAPKIRVDEERESLVAYDIEWTPAAVDALKAGEWKYISPEFNPRGYPWEDPEAEFEFVDNVITGAALTNIPLFKKMKPIMASRLPSKKKADVTSGDGNKTNPEGEGMKIEEIRAKEVADLTDEEKTFLSEHKTELTNEERTKFDLADAPAEPTTPTEPTEPTAPAEPVEPVEPTETKVEASTKGAVSINASELAALKASAARADALAAEIDRNKATATVKASIKAGQVKSGEENSWVDFLTGLKADQRGVAEKLLASLPKNETLGQELGDVGKDVEVETELDTRVSEAVKASEGKLTYSQAMKQVLASDSELRERITAERSNQTNKS